MPLLAPQPIRMAQPQYLPPLDKPGVELLRAINGLMQSVFPEDAAGHSEALQRAVRIGWGDETADEVFSSPEAQQSNWAEIGRRWDEMRKERRKLGEPEVADPAIAMMSLDRPASYLDLAGRLAYLVQTGRATADEVIIVSQRSEAAQQTFVESREAIPAGTFDTGADVDENGAVRFALSPAERSAEADADFVFGKGRR